MEFVGCSTLQLTCTVEQTQSQSPGWVSDGDWKRERGGKEGENEEMRGEGRED